MSADEIQDIVNLATLGIQNKAGIDLRVREIMQKIRAKAERSGDMETLAALDNIGSLDELLMKALVAGSSTLDITGERD